MKRKLVTVLLAGSMVLTAMGNIAYASEGTGEDWMTPYDETVTLSTVREAVAYEFPEGEDLTNSVWTKAYKDVLNVEVVTDWTSDEYDTKLNLAIASGDLPDVFVADDVQLKQLQEAGMIMDLTEVYEEYASDTLKGLMEAEPSVFATAKVDDKIYAIPRLSGGFHPSLLWLRNDWLEETGLEVPATIEELEAVLTAMKDISGNYALAIDQTLSGLYSLAAAWGVYPEIWVKGEDGNLVYGATVPEMKEALAIWNKWYDAGILKSDFATMNEDAVKQDVVSGKAGAMMYPSWQGWTFGIDEVKQQGTDALFLAHELPTADGKAAVYPRQFSNDDYIVVNKNCENPDAVLKLIDYYVYIQADAYTNGDMTAEEVEVFNANNMQHTTRPFSVTNTLEDINRYEMVKEARETGDESVLKISSAVECYNATMKWLNEQDPDYVAYATQFGMEGSAMEKNYAITNDNRIQNDALWGSAPQELLDYGSTLDDILLEGFTKIIMGAEDVDYFDTLIEQWYVAGGQTATDAVNARYNH
ncbi:MAG TPA: hypothetical protein DCZ20_06055 [Lachnospiraceae bacterium]|nr:hypothetical protein [Lachnospiraceae bacterium]